MKKFSLLGLVLAFAVVISALVLRETLHTVAYIDAQVSSTELSSTSGASFFKRNGRVAGAATCGLTDSLLRTLPNLTVPARGGNYTDPTFGCKITRLSNATVEGSSYVMHAYSSVNPFNSDNTMVLLEKSGGILHVRDLLGNTVKDNLHNFGILPSSNPVWSRTDPNVIYFHPVSSNQVKKYNLSTNAVTTEYTFSSYAQISFGNGEGDISWDGNYLPILADGRYGFIYNINAKTVVGPKDLLGPTSTGGSGGEAPDVVDLTTKNKFVYLWAGSGSGVSFFDNQLNFIRRALNYSGHSDRAEDLDGSEILVITNSADASPIADCQNGIVKSNLALGTQTCLQQLDWSLAVHISCNNGNQGWCIVSTYDPSHAGAWKAYTDEILLVNLNSSQTIRLAHTRSSNSAYERFPRAALSGNGRYVLFDSDMRGANVDTYLLDLQNGSTPPLPAPVDTEAPSVPNNLSGTALSSSQINLSWSPATDNVGVVGYKIYRSGAQIATSTTANYQNTNLSPSTSYSYTVSAFDAAGNVSAQSASVTVLSLPIADVAPPQLNGIQAVNLGSRSATIVWQTNEGATTRVEFGRTSAYGTLSVLNVNLVTSHSVTLSGLARNTTYHFRVLSKDAAGNSAVSGDYTFTTRKK